MGFKKKEIKEEQPIKKKMSLWKTIARWKDETASSKSTDII